jgi:hypothetical protein
MHRDLQGFSEDDHTLTCNTVRAAHSAFIHEMAECSDDKLSAALTEPNASNAVYAQALHQLAQRARKRVRRSMLRISALAIFFLALIR